MDSSPTRRRAILGAAAVPLSAGLISLALPKSVLACHTYVSPIDGKKGCSARSRDDGRTSTSSTSSRNNRSNSSSSTTSRNQSSKTGLVYRSETVGFNQSSKSGLRNRLRVGRAPDGKRAIEATYKRGRSACAANTFLELFGGNGVSSAIFDVDIWISPGFRGDIPGKLFGVYGGGDAYGGTVNRKPGCRNQEGGWSSRVSHGPEGRVYMYSYHQNRKERCRGDKKFGGGFYQKKTVVTGRWMTFRQQIIMNSRGRADGRLRVWMNGSKLFDVGGIMYQRESDKYGIKGWSLWSALGGSCRNSKLFPKETFSVWYRDLRVYR